MKRSDYEIEHRPHGTVVWYSEPDGTLVKTLCER